MDAGIASSYKEIAKAENIPSFFAFSVKMFL
jgi:hypothetical protein